MNAFFDAVAAGDVSAVEAELAQKPALASARSPEGISALLVAAYRGHHGVVDALRSAGAELDAFDAAALGDLTLLERQLDLDPNLAEAFSADGFTALHFAAFFGRPDAVALLLTRAAPIEAEARNDMRVRPLHSAAACFEPKARRRCCELLLEAGAEVDARQQGGFTALMEAAQHGDAELVRLLLARGADPHLAADDGRTAANIGSLDAPQV
ncbi:MAG TPA: ankyrin repeat domain-containing protein [Acidimicrobiales bacterium]